MKLKSQFAAFLIIPILLELSLYSSGVSASPSPSPFDSRYLEQFAQGEQLRLEGEYEKALLSFSRCAALAAESGSKKEELEARIKLGLLLWNLGRLKESETAYLDALALAKSSGLKDREKEVAAALEIYNLYNKAKALRSDGDPMKAVELYGKAIDLASKIGSPDHELKCLRQMSVCHWDQNDLQKFRRLNEKALGIAQKIRNKKDEGICLNNIGAYYWKIDDYSKALEYFEHALAIAREINNAQSENEALNNIGIIYKDIGDYDKALVYLNNALSIDRRAFGKDYISIDLCNIGTIYRKKGLLSGSKEDIRKALEYFHKSIDLIIEADNKKTAIYIYNNIGTVHSDLENYGEALKYFRLGLGLAEKTNDKESISLISNNMGNVHYKLGDYEESTKYFQKAIDLALEINAGKILWEAFLDMANSYEKQGKLDEALNYFKRSISVIEKARSTLDLEELKASYLGAGRRLEAYQNLIDLLVRLHRADPGKAYDAEAFSYLEKAKARAFLDSLEVAQVEISQGIDARLLNEEKRLNNDIAGLYKKLLTPDLAPGQKNEIDEKIKKCEDDYEKLKREIRSTSPAYADLKYPDAVTLGEVRKNLADDGTTFISYAVGKDGSYGFAVSRAGLKIFPLPARKNLQAKIAAFLKVVSDKDASDFHLGRELYAELVRPGLDQRTKRLVFVPDDILHFLPFETLVRNEGADRWLIQDFSVAYAPSLSSLREIIDRGRANGKKPKKDLLAFGNPDYGPAGVSASASASSAAPSSASSDVFQDFFSSSAFRFFPLKYSAAETARIASLFEKDREDVFLGDQASEQTLLKLDLSDYRIIHFAAHGLIDDHRPARSSIVLSLDPKSAQDGFVQVREIYNLKMRADLVGLSACQTGMGQFIRGEGIEGLNRAFFYAGASSVLMTLWSVNDQAASELMERFYGRLRASQSITDALRGAKLDMIGSPALAHPYYWAGYVAAGDAAKVIFPRSKTPWILGGIALCLVALAGMLWIILSPRTGSSSSGRKRERSTTGKKPR
jgi:CHAT domain-containing protein/Tfp pilus assembly protein PilF